MATLPSGDAETVAEESGDGRIIGEVAEADGESGSVSIRGLELA